MNPINTVPPAHIARLSPDDAERNKKAREDAAAVVELCEVQPQRFWEVLAELSGVKCNQVTAPAVADMTDTKPFNHFQATKFENTIIQYGVHSNKTIAEIPTEYLAWLAEGDEFVKDIRRYVKSARFKERQRRE